MDHYKRFFLLLVAVSLSACASITVDVQEPVSGSTVSTPTFELRAEIRSTGKCMGGERCDHTDWALAIDGRTVCSGTGTGGSGDYSWCGNRMGDYCIFHWDNVSASDLGSGNHVLRVSGSADCHRDGHDSVTITVP